MAYCNSHVSSLWLLLLVWFHNAVLVATASSFKYANVISPVSTRMGLRAAVAFLSPTDHRHRCRHRYSRGKDGRFRAAFGSIGNQRTPSCHVLSKSIAHGDENDHGNTSSNENESNLERIYQQVQQDDADWYYSTLAKFLGDEAASVETINSLDFDKDAEGTKNIDSSDGTRAISDHESQTHDEATAGQTCDEVGRPLTSATLKDDRPADKAEPLLRATESIRNHETPNNSVGDNPVAVGNRYDTLSRHGDSKDVDNLEITDSFESLKIVRLRNKYTKHSEVVASLSKFSNMGYTQSDVVLLRPRVLELIVEDSIPKPRRGIPDRWLRDVYEDLDDEDVDWEVEVVDDDSVLLKGDDDGDGIDRPYKRQRSRKSSFTPDEIKEKEEVKKLISRSSDQNVSESWGPFSSSRVIVNQREETTSKVNDDNQKDIELKKEPGFNTLHEESDAAPTSYRRSTERKPRLKPIIDDRDDSEPQSQKNGISSPLRRSYYEEEEDSYQKPPRRREADRRQPRPRRRRELVIDRDEDDDNDPPPNKFWMDLPTFRDFLRTEARLRLKILGPDWKESVLDESRWRFDLYKRWLFLLNDGVGENPLYKYNDRPSQPRPHRPRSRGERSFESSAVRERPNRKSQSRSGSVSSGGREPYSETKGDKVLRDTRGRSLWEEQPEELSSQRGVRQSRSDMNGYRDAMDDDPLRGYGKGTRRSAIGEVGRISIMDQRARAGYREFDDREMLVPRGDSEATDDRPIRRPSSPQPSSSRREKTDLKNFNDLEQYLQWSSESVSNEQRDDLHDAPSRRKRSTKHVFNEKL
ncbi:hypothetical protein ACHAW6_005501 [Cyclotella cf. meneghiniana]